MRPQSPEYAEHSRRIDAPTRWLLKRRKAVGRDCRELADCRLSFPSSG